MHTLSATMEGEGVEARNVSDMLERGKEAEARAMKPYYEENGIVIYNADCREILPSLPRVDLVLTDPPYGIGESSTKAATRIQLSRPRNYGEFHWDVKLDQPTLNLAANAGYNAIIFGGNYYANWLPASSGWLVWHKDNSGDFADCELAWTNLQQATRYFRWRWNGMLQEDMAHKEERVHPTQKPLAVMKWAASWSNGSILDPFMGSGTTLRAAKDLGRKAIGIEIEEKYCEIAANRLRQEVLNFDEVRR